MINIAIIVHIKKKRRSERLNVYVRSICNAAFTQIVILGSARYQSFMDLSTNDRRTIIEEILDITVFSKMNTVLKTKMTDTTLEMRENDYQKEVGKTKVSSQKGLIKNLLGRAKESEEKIEEERSRIQLEIDKKKAIQILS